MRKRVAAPLFYLLTIVLFPIALLGYVLWIGRLLLQRRSGISATAQGPLSARWVQHRLGVRPDAAAERLLMALPGVSPAAVWLSFGPLLLAHRLSGYVPPTFRYPFVGAVTLRNQASARQSYYDAVVERYIPEVAQLVILGAGFDTRAFRLPSATQIRAFEVDTPRTQQIKQAVLANAHVDVAGVTFVAADLERESWRDRLVAAGFAPGQPALFVWEGVTPYLERAAVEETLRMIAGLAEGTAVAFDYLTTDVLESRSPYLRLVRASLRAGGEPLKFGLDSTPPVRAQVEALLRACGLCLAEHRPSGQETGSQRTWGGFVTAVVCEAGDVQSEV